MLFLCSRLCCVVSSLDLSLSFAIQAASMMWVWGEAYKYVNVHTCACTAAKLCRGMDARVLVSEQVRMMAVEY